MMATMLPPDHNIELKCRICAVDFKITSEGVPIFKTDQLEEKIKNYLHINVNSLDKLSHLVCNECVRKLESFHCYALMAQKNQELFNIMYSEKIYREHCTALSSLNTTLYREPATPVRNTTAKAQKTQAKTKPNVAAKKQTAIQNPSNATQKTISIQQQQQQQQIHLQNQQQKQLQTPITPQQPVTLLSTEDITIFAYQDLKLGQIIKDQELLKLILRALKWNDVGMTTDAQLEKLRSTSFRTVLSSPDLLRDEDLVQLLGPYLDHGSFAPVEHTKPGIDFSQKMIDQNPVTEMEVGVDPELFLPYDDEETKSVDHDEIMMRFKIKKDTKRSMPRMKTTARKIPASTTVTAVPKIMIPTTVPVPVPIPIVSKTITTTIALPVQKQTPTQPKTPKGLTVMAQPLPQLIEKQTQDVLTVEPLPPVEDGSEKLSTMAEVAAAAEPMPIDPPKSTDVPPKEIPAPQITVKTTSSTTKTTSTPVPAPSSSSSSQANETDKIVPLTRNQSPRETKITRSSRKTKIDLTIGPKTRARSVFNAKHKCNVCNKKFSTNGNLQAHMKTHKPKGKFNCDKCGRVFKSQVNLQRHKDYHAGERFFCRTCGRVYPTNSALKQHEIAHSNFRPHKCNTCSKTFKRNQDLKFHMNQHTGEKPYKCPYCPRAFASSGNCFSHRKRVHSDKTNNKKAMTNEAFNKKCIKV